MFLYMSMCTLVHLFAEAKYLGSFGAGVTGSCKLLNVGTVDQIQVFWKSSMLS